MMVASRPLNAAAPKRPTPVPPALTLILSSDLASAISFRIRLEMSRLASVTKRPMVGSSGLRGVTGSGGAIDAFLVITAPFAATSQRRWSALGRARFRVPRLEDSTARAPCAVTRRPGQALSGLLLNAVSYTHLRA